MTAKNHRLTRLDLCRGIAIYAVVVQNSGDETWAEVGYWAAALRSFCSFAVPFFLATSFYLMVRKLYINKTKYSLISRMQRLLIPYIFWSALYLFLKSARFLLLNESDDLRKLFLDPISLIFIGGSSVQLYFLPLLLAGTLLMPLAAYLIKKIFQSTD
ncbi:MAG TPA: acyltransferase family protein [Allocoleopsis sp.]